jgi:hypothetical protein
MFRIINSEEIAIPTLLRFSVVGIRSISGILRPLFEYFVYLPENAATFLGLRRPTKQGRCSFCVQPCEAKVEIDGIAPTSAVY